MDEKGSQPICRREVLESDMQFGSKPSEQAISSTSNIDVLKSNGTLPSVFIFPLINSWLVSLFMKGVIILKETHCS